MLKEQVRFSDTRSTFRPTPDEIRAAVRETLTRIKDRALDTERNRRVPQENIRALREAGMFKVVQPQEFGGYEYDYTVLADIIIDVAAACASTAWIAGLFSAHQWLLANLSLQAQRDVWLEDPDAVICGSYAPTGKAIAVEGGYRLTGRWEFASGCDNAQWSFCAAMVPGDAEGTPPRPAFFLVSAQDYSIDDTWDVIGLAGTGSKTLVLEDAFAPGHRLVFLGPLLAGKALGSVTYPQRGFDVPMLSLIPSCLASVSVGAAKGALEDYVAATSKRVTRGAVVGANNRMADFATIQLRVAEAAASIDAARMILLRDIENVTKKVREAGAADPEDRITSRRGQAFAVSLSIRAAEALNASTGGYGLAMTNSVQRAWRDANAVGRHISLNWDVVGTMYGQMALGLEPRGQF